MGGVITIPIDAQRVKWLTQGHSKWKEGAMNSSWNSLLQTQLRWVVQVSLIPKTMLYTFCCEHLSIFNTQIWAFSWENSSPTSYYPKPLFLSKTFSFSIQLPSLRRFLLQGQCCWEYYLSIIETLYNNFHSCFSFILKIAHIFWKMNILILIGWKGSNIPFFFLIKKHPLRCLDL